MARYSVSLGDKLATFVDKESKDMGISKNAFIALCINSYKKQEESISMTGQFQDMLTQAAALSEGEKQSIKED